MILCVNILDLRYTRSTKNQTKKKEEEGYWKNRKKKRSELFNAGRDLIATVEESDDSDAMDWSSFKVPTFHRLYKDVLMLSEWLIDVPEDLEQEWYMVPCPEGRRTTVVACKNKTMSFTKAGYNTATFKSLLPGGSHASERGYTKLDCIWSLKDHTYYILDVLSWGKQSVMDCETEFRFYWLKTKLEDIYQLGTKCKENPFIFKSLPYYKCTKDAIAEVMTNENMFSNEGPRLDGLLFYHSKTPYTSGLTPLVGWLKPYMITEMLGIQVAALYQQEYVDCKRKNIQHIRNKKRAEAEAEAEAEVEQEMETSNTGMVCGAD